MRKNAGAANPWMFVVLGAIVVAAGIAVKGQPWTTPAMFAALDLDFSKVFISAGAFTMWMPVFSSLFYAPLREAIDTRQQDLDKTFTEAENLKEDMIKLRADYETRLAKTESDARDQIQNQIREAQNLRQSLIAEAASKADEMKKAAEKDVDSMVEKARRDLRTHVVELTLEATEKLIGVKCDPVADGKLVEEFISDSVAVK